MILVLTLETYPELRIRYKKPRKQFARIFPASETSRNLLDGIFVALI
jgi:hypothetical protein